MPKGIIGGLHMNTGQVISEGNVYNFNIANVQGTVVNQQEIDFELDDNGNVKVIFGKGVAPAPKPAVPEAAPTPKPKSSRPKPKPLAPKQKEGNVFDQRDFLTEEK